MERPSSEPSKRIMTTALAPITVAFWIMRSSACRREASSSSVYSLISPPPRDRSPQDVAAEPPTPDDQAEDLPLDLHDALAGHVLRRRHDHVCLPPTSGVNVNPRYIPCLTYGMAR